MPNTATIEAIRDAAYAKILEIQGRPDYTSDGKAVQFQAQVAELKRTVDWCQAQIEGEEPFEVVSQIDTYN